MIVSIFLAAGIAVLGIGAVLTQMGATRQSRRAHYRDEQEQDR